MKMKNRLGNNILRLLELAAPAFGRTEWGAMQHITGKPNLVSAIRAGAGFTVDTYDEVVQDFSNYWPAGLPWPADIDRPAPVESALIDQKTVAAAE